MSIENSQNQSDLIRSLASTIQKKILAPTSCKLESINLEIGEINQKITDLQKEYSLLTEAHHKTRVLAAVTTLGMAVLGIVLIIVLL